MAEAKLQADCRDPRSKTSFNRSEFRGVSDERRPES
jgi:hypothetical protein